MDFKLTEEQQMIKSNARDFLDREIAPAAAERDDRGPLTREETVGFIKQLMPFGYYNGWLPAEFGGSGLDRKTGGLLHEELSRAWASLAGTILMAGGSGAILGAGEGRRKEIVERVRAGSCIRRWITPTRGSRCSRSMGTTSRLSECWPRRTAAWGCGRRRTA